MLRKIILHKRFQQSMAILFWIAIWQILSMQKILGLFVASPLQTAGRLLELLGTSRFYLSVLYTSGRILTGFLLGVLAGTILAVLTWRYEWIDILVQPVMRLIRTVPVASFIILALILLSSRYLTQLISFLMALPIICMNVKTGIGQTDGSLVEMARLFHVPRYRMIRHLYIPQVMPAFTTATSLALSFSWKSGIAAEVIGMPTGSIGERLQQAKVYLNTPDLFAWTLVIVLLSMVSDKLWKKLLAGVK